MTHDVRLSYGAERFFFFFLKKEKKKLNDKLYHIIEPKIQFNHVILILFINLVL